MELKSVFEMGGMIPSEYTCDGKNISPPLEIVEVPDDCVSLALIIDDPDAPKRVFTHWMIWNISPDLRKIPEGKVPKGIIEGKNGTGEKGYTGPCLHSGQHRYHFKLYALNEKISLDSNASKDQLISEIEEYVIDRAILIGRYSRKQG